MRISCPYCGLRDAREFTYRGDAAPVRPDSDSAADFHDYVFLRDNPAGVMDELWQHTGGCRSWLVVTRDTRSHDILAVAYSDKSRS